MEPTTTGNGSESPGFWSVTGPAFPDGEKLRWNFERVIGEGGTGIVHQVFDRLMERRVALKILKPALADTPHGIDLFLQEPRVAARLPHPHIVPIYEVGQHEDRGCFFTMELVRGKELEEVLQGAAEEEWGAARALPLVDVFRKICDAVALAHSRGVVHADLKPENIRVGEFGQVYLLDWGLARVVDYQTWAVDPNSVAGYPDLLSNPKVIPGITGTPLYMAPEMMSGEPPDMRTDIFAMGVTLYRILTGEPPFPGTNLRELLNARRGGKITPPRATRHGIWIPPELERLVLKAMAIDPAERYPDARALAADLPKLSRYGAHFPVVEFAPGERITRAGEVPDATYVILDGRCGVYADAESDEVLLDEAGPGHVLGEEAILTGDLVSPTSAVALEPTSASRLTRETAEYELSAMSPWVGTVLKSLAERNRSTVAQRLRARQALGYLAREGRAETAAGALVTPGWAALTRHLATSRLLSAFAEGASPEQLLDRTCNFVFESFNTMIPFERLGVALLEQGGEVVKMRWSRQDGLAEEGISPDYSAPLKGSSLEAIVETRQPRIIDDLREFLVEYPGSQSTAQILRSGLRSNLTCPLVVADAVVGFFFFSSLQPGAYRDEHVDMYRLVADDVSELVAAARSGPDEGPYPEEVLVRVGGALLDLSSVVEEARDEVRLLAEVARRSRAGHCLTEILDHIFETFGTVIPYDRIGFASLEEEGRVAHARWFRSRGDVVGIDEQYSANIERSSLADVLASGRPRILNNLEEYLEEHPESESTRLILKEGIRSSLTCPLASMGSPVGFLFFSSRTPRAYEPSHVETFIRIADQLAIAVERADLNRALQEARERIAALEG